MIECYTESYKPSPTVIHNHEDAIKLIRSSILKKIIFFPIVEAVQFSIIIPEATHGELTFHNLDYSFVVKYPNDKVWNLICSYEETHKHVRSYIDINKDSQHFTDICKQSAFLMAMVLGQR